MSAASRRKGYDANHINLMLVWLLDEFDQLTGRRASLK
jgi:hypothetical protein